jgi:hypothetical protein
MRRSVAILPMLTIYLAGCAAAIATQGTHETSILHEGSTRLQVTKFLGEPVTSFEFAPVPLGELMGRNIAHIEALVPQVRTDHSDAPPYIWAYPDVSAIRREEYLYIGNIVGPHDVGEVAALDGYTMGLAELFMVPTLIANREKREKTSNTVTVWYDSSDTALAYIWIREMPATNNPQP